MLLSLFHKVVSRGFSVQSRLSSTTLFPFKNILKDKSFLHFISPTSVKGAVFSNSKGISLNPFSNSGGSPYQLTVIVAVESSDRRGFKVREEIDKKTVESQLVVNQ